MTPTGIEPATFRFVASVGAWTIYRFHNALCNNESYKWIWVRIKQCKMASHYRRCIL